MLMPEKTVNPSVTLPGKVEKIIKPLDRTDTEKAQINIEEGADPLYKEIRIENTLTSAEGEAVSLKKGAKVIVTVDADPSATIPKRET